MKKQELATDQTEPPVRARPDTTEAAPLRHHGEQADAEIREINQALVIADIHQRELAEAAARADEARREDQICLTEQARQATILEERSRIAREIHDTLAQAFTGILLQLRVAQRISKQRPEEAWSLIEHVSELASEGLAEARRSVWALQPDAEEYSDLVGALSRTIERMRPETAAQMKLDIHGTPRPLPPDVGMHLLRIGEEALTNALRHARAHMVWIQLTFGAEHAQVRVQDNGQGFDLKRQADGGGFGLISIGQRAERLGGELTIASQPGRGTEVAVSVPIVPAQIREEDR